MKPIKSVRKASRKIKEAVNNTTIKEQLSLPKNKIKPTKIKNKVKI